MKTAIPAQPGPGSPAPAGATVSDTDVTRIFEQVRDIPFGFAPHQDAETLLSCGFGTCAPKHTLLAHRYAALGLCTRYVYITFRFDDMLGRFPDQLAAMLHDGRLRGHVALQVERNGRWVDVDATFDAPLAEAGFRVTRDWDGRSSMPLTVVPVGRVESAVSPARYAELQDLHRQTALPADVVRRVNAWLVTVRKGRPELKRD